MNLWVELACEPKELLLCWEAPLSEADRYKWVVGRVTATPAGTIFAYLEGQDFLDLNLGRTEGALRAAGYLGYPAFDPRKGVVFTDQVSHALVRRLPPRTRPDFPRYLEQFRLPDGMVGSDLFLLGATEARLPSDGFSLINPLDPAVLAADVLVEIAGYRHYLPEAAAPELGRHLALVPNPDNEYDKHAVRFEAAGQLIGHIARFQAPTVLDWLDRGSVEAFLVKRNGTADRPKGFALLRYRSAEDHRAAA